MRYDIESSYIMHSEPHVSYYIERITHFVQCRDKYQFVLEGHERHSLLLLLTFSSVTLSENTLALYRFQEHYSD